MDISTTLHRVIDALPTPLSGFGDRREVYRLPADLYETADAYVAVFDAPGVNQSDVQVKFVDRTIMVRIDRFRDLHPEFETCVAQRPMAADGQVQLPVGVTVAPESAGATLRTDGTLRIQVPKRTTRAATASDDAQSG